MSERLTEWIDKNRRIAVPMPDLSYNYQKCFNKLAHYEDMEEQRGNMINTENIKELLYYRKAIKILKEDDSSREVWYVGENSKIYCMRGNTAILALQQGIYRFYDTYDKLKEF